MYIDWKITLAIIAIFIGILRLLFPEQFRELGYLLWPRRKNQKSRDPKYLPVSQDLVLEEPSEPLISSELGKKYPDFKFEKINDLLEDLKEYQAEGDLKKISKTYEKIEKKLLTDGIREPVPKLRLLMGNNALKAGNMAEAEKLFKSCISLAIELNDKIIKEKGEQNLGIINKQ